MYAYEIWDEYQHKHFRRTEGPEGVRNLEQLTRNLGYMSLEDFLEDNPGAVQAILEFVGEWVDRSTEWAAKLEETVDLEDEE